MPASEQPQIPRIEITAITEQELQKPGAAKLIYKRVTELEADTQGLRAQMEIERVRREQVVAQFHLADTNRQILQERLAVLGHRNAVCQTIWGAIAIIIGLAIDSAKSANWMNLGFSIGAAILLAIAVYLASSYPILGKK